MPSQDDTALCGWVPCLPLTSSPCTLAFFLSLKAPAGLRLMALSTCCCSWIPALPWPASSLHSRLCSHGRGWGWGGVGGVSSERPFLISVSWFSKSLPIPIFCITFLQSTYYLTLHYMFTAVIVQLHLGRGFKKPVLQAPPKPIKSEYEGGGQASLFYKKKKTPPRDSNVQPGAHSPERASQTSMCI